jgi:hypothetical protein
MASMKIAYLALLTISPWNQFTRIAPRNVEVVEAGDEGDQRPHLGFVLRSPADGARSLAATELVSDRSLCR